MPETRNQEAAPPRPAAFAPLNGVDVFELPCGRIAKMSDVVELNPVGGTVDSLVRYQEEVRLIQSALGVEPDGKIGPDTRRAAREIQTRFSRDVVKEAFAKLWMEAFHLGIEARDAGLPEAVHAVCAYLHNKLCMALADLKGEEHLDLDVSTKRPVFGKLGAPIWADGPSDSRLKLEPKVAETDRLVPRRPKPTDEVPIERWAIEDILKQLVHAPARPIGLENYLKARLAGDDKVGILA